MSERTLSQLKKIAKLAFGGIVFQFCIFNDLNAYDVDGSLSKSLSVDSTTNVNRTVYIPPANNSDDIVFRLQEITVTGQITTEDEPEGLPGVSVVLKGTSTGTVSDINGRYSIAVPSQDAVLVFTYVGYVKEEVNVENRSVININLKPDVSQLEEIVVVAYGTQKKSHVTAAVSQIEGKALEDRPLRSIADALNGLAPGLNVRSPSGAPEATPNLNIRGFTGFNSSQQPLILVDGIERELYDINPNDIESISVLKDGAATAIYGSRAPHGIIQITTKSGERGEEIKFSVSSNFRFGRPYGLPEQLDNYEWVGYINEAYRNQPGGGTAPFFSETQIARMKAYAEGDFTNPVFEGIDPEYVPYGTFPIGPTNWGAHQDTFANVNWLDEALVDIVPSEEHNISMSGGSNRTSYYMSLGYNESVGMFKGTNFKNRYSALIKLDTDVTDWLTINLSTNYVKTAEEGPNFGGRGRDYGTMFNIFARAFPIWVTTNPNGSSGRFNSLPQLIGKGGTESRNLNRILLSGGVTINPAKGFTIKGSYTWNNTNNNFNRNTLQIFQVLPNGNTVPDQRSSRSFITRRFDNNDYHTIDLHASYSKTINNIHNFNAMIGYQQEHNMFTQLEGGASDFFSQSVLAISTSSANFQTSDRIYDWSTRGFFGRFSYNYDEKYFIEFNGRRDATSRFLPENRWGTFPSIAAGWNIAAEAFWPFKELVTQFKPRASWSTSGSANVGLYPFYPSVNINLASNIILDGGLAYIATMPPLVSDQLTWARPTTIDVGFDLQSFENRLELNYDWYQRTVKDQFGPPPSIPKTIGAGVPDANNAISETRGWELNLTWKDKAFDLFNKPVRYNFGLRYSDFIGYVVEYEDDGTGAVVGQWTPGQIFGQNFHYASNGIMQNTEALYANTPQGGTWYYPGDLAVKDLNGDGEINSGIAGTWYNRGDLVKNGYNYPRGTYGITLGAEWNNFDLTLLLDGVMQWTQYSTHMYVWGNSGMQWFAPYYKEHARLGYWSPDNTDAFYPRNMYAGKNRLVPNDQYALDLSHLRIRNLKLGYNVPQVLAQKIRMSRVYLYASAENLGFIYNNAFIKYDPELLAGANGEGYPPLQYFSFGANLQF